MCVGPFRSVCVCVVGCVFVCVVGCVCVVRRVCVWFPKGLAGSGAICARRGLVLVFRSMRCTLIQGRCELRGPRKWNSHFPWVSGRSDERRISRRRWKGRWQKKTWLDGRSDKLLDLNRILFSLKIGSDWTKIV